jgi:hypothetical protein
VRASWLPVADEKGRTVGRYAYWVEDLQGRIDPKIAGNDAGEGNQHARVAYPFPAPGLNDQKPADDEKSLDQIALYAVDPSATEKDQKSLGKSLLKNRKLLLSPDSSLAGAGVLPPLLRDSAGHLAEPTARAAEEGLSAGVKSYKELAVVPFAEGIDPSVAGQPKLNLNRLLAKGDGAAVDEMASFIRKALPQFEQRKGGFPDDYIKTLAANAIDYADQNDAPLTVANSYRGLDAYPHVSEFLMRVSWDDADNGDLTFTVITYAELWNTTDKPVSGDFQLSYETGYEYKVGLNPEGIKLADLANATPKLEFADGYHWFPKIKVALKPNEYKVIRCGMLTYKWSFGFFVPSPVTLTGDSWGRSKSGYRMKWNDVLVDQARGSVHRNDCSLYYRVPGKSPLAVRCTIPGHSYSRQEQAFINNMGDPRMSFYLGAPQDANAYPINYSPNRRTIRWGSIYGNTSGARDKNAPTKPSVFGRVMPSEWPDGGHNSAYGSNAFYSEDINLLPDDVRFMKDPPEPVMEEAPTRLSNLGRFYSATELGRVYDPIMWETTMPTGANQPSWGDVTANAKDPTRGGGNTLRIGRPEHPFFNKLGSPGMEAYRLLDLFHAGISRSDEISEVEGNLIEVEGKVNLNTANRDVLRALAIGALTMDPLMCKRTSENHELKTKMAPPTSPYAPTAAETVEEANRIADAIIALRAIQPFASPGAMAEATATTKVTPVKVEQVIGNKKMVADGNKIHRTDSAAEEVFGRIYEASTVRSRNFRIWVVGQSLSPTTGNNTPEVLAEVRRAYTVFADPGERASDGSIIPEKTKLTILHENDF